MAPFAKPVYPGAFPGTISARGFSRFNLFPSGNRGESKVMKRAVLKSTPVLRFQHDSSAVRGVEIVNLLEEVDKLPKALEEEV